jgi:hypothetical protein
VNEDTVYIQIVYGDCYCKIIEGECVRGTLAQCSAEKNGLLSYCNNFIIREKK